MKKPLKTVSIGTLLMTPALSLALGLGDIEVQSKLNEPLQAEIRLLYSDADEVASTSVELASAEDFERVGLDAGSLPFDLRFEVERNDNGEFVIKVHSGEAITEPFLDFLVEVNWANGRLLREYVVLLDPPVVAPAAGPAVTPIADRPFDEPTPVPVEDEPPSTTPSVVDTGPSTTPSTTPTGYPGGDNAYGPVSAGETLWEIARDWRPNSDISINQMMVLLHQMNPDAFYQDNINALSRGAILRLPTQEDFNRLSQTEATAEVRSQNEMWESYRLSAARSVPTVSDAGVSPSYDSGYTPPPADDSRLELVPPSGDATSSLDRPGDGSDVFEADLAEIRSDLQRTREDLLSATQENVELQSRVGELESLVTNLERAITLKDADIADLQVELELARQGVDALSSDVADATDPVGYDTGYDSGFDTTADVADTSTDTGFADPVDDSGFDTGFADPQDTTSDTGFDTPDDSIDDAAPVDDTTPDTGDVSTTPPAVVTTPPADDSRGVMGVLTNPFVIGGLLVVVLGVGAFFFQRRRQALAGESLIDAMMEEDEYIAPEVASPPPAAEPEPVAATAVAPVLSENSLINAIEANPADPQSHLALLRMYYTENERDKFVTAAERMHEQFGGTGHPAWAEVRGMGANLAGDHSLFGGSAGEEEEAGLDLQGSSVPSDPEDEFSLDLDLGGDEDESSPGLDLSSGDDGGDDLDLDLDLDADTPAADSGDDLSLDLDLDEEPVAAEADSGGDDLGLDLDLEPEPGGVDTADELESLDFDLDGDEPAAASEPEAKEEHTEFELEAVTDEAVSDDDDLGLGDLDLDLDTSDDEATPTETAADDSLDDLDLGDLGDLDLGEEMLAGGDDDAVGTKLDLAKAYIDMGDPDGARGMLEEVVAEGSDSQKEEAQKLLSDLG